jgi:hypothetical protein
MLSLPPLPTFNEITDRDARGKPPDPPSGQSTEASGRFGRSHCRRSHGNAPAAFAYGGAPCRLNGSVTVKVVPAPRALYTAICPRAFDDLPADREAGKAK